MRLSGHIVAKILSFIKSAVDYKVLLLMTFSFFSASSFLISSHADKTSATPVSDKVPPPPPECIVIEKNGLKISTCGDQTFNPQKVQKEACDELIKNLDTELKAFGEACARFKKMPTSLCLSQLFKCQESESEKCEEFKSLLNPSSLREEDLAKTKVLENSVKDLEDKKEKIADDIDKTQSEIEAIRGQIDNLHEKQQEAQKQVNEQIQKNRNRSNDRAVQIQAEIQRLQGESDKLFNQTLDQQKALNDLISKYQLKCRAESFEKGQAYFNKVDNGLRKGRISITQMIQRGGASISDLAKSYARRQRKKCMQINGNTEYGIMYRSLMANMELQKQSMTRMNERILEQQRLLSIEIQGNRAVMQLRDSELFLELAQTNQVLSQQISQKRLDILWRGAKIQERLGESRRTQKKIDKKRDEIIKIKSTTMETTEEDLLQKIREAFISAESLIYEAKYAADQQCPCGRSSLSTISRYSSENFCSPPSRTPSPNPQELRDPSKEPTSSPSGVVM